MSRAASLTANLTRRSLTPDPHHIATATGRLSGGPLNHRVTVLSPTGA